MKILYKKTSTGKIQQWSIWVDGNTIHSESGQVDGKKILSKDIVKYGKNIGRSNETTNEEQAVVEAKSKHTKKLKSGYVDSIDKAQADETDGLITGGYVPMTALVFEKAEKHLKYPAAAQPKLDGMRCCTTEDGLFTRTRKPIKMIPHIEVAIKELVDKMGVVHLWDGELYNHKLKDDFEKIISLIKRDKELHPEHKLVQYHIYDVNMAGGLLERRKIIKEAEKLCGPDSPLVFVKTLLVQDKESLTKVYNKFLDQGYEGAMARNLDLAYEQKRSKALMKMKLFQDDEFEVIGIEEGRGKLAGHVGAFVCKIPSTYDTHGERTFTVKLGGKLSMLKTYFENESMWMNKMMTVQFLRISNKNYKPIIPTGVRFRAEE